MGVILTSYFILGWSSKYRCSTQSWDDECRRRPLGVIYIYHGNTQPSVLGVITHVLGGLKHSFFMVLGSKGICTDDLQLRGALTTWGHFRTVLLPLLLAPLRKQGGYNLGFVGWNHFPWGMTLRGVERPTVCPFIILILCQSKNVSILFFEDLLFCRVWHGGSIFLLPPLCWESCIFDSHMIYEIGIFTVHGWLIIYGIDQGKHTLGCSLPVEDKGS